jgi:murein DD-endopeptidase MepM/ murein hydrolase activator NlpD
MQVRIPFIDNDKSGEEFWEEAYKNEKKTLSGVYPLVIRFTWHTGIHLSNKNDEDNGEEPDYSKNFIKPIVDGEIIAYKLAKDYDTLPLESSEIWHSSIGELEKKLGRTKTNYSDLYKKIAHITGQPIDESAENVAAKIKNSSPNTTEEFKEALSRVLTPFSTSFVLTRHKLKLNNEREITYFILYSNLAPISDYDIPGRDVCRTFFPKWVLSKEEIEQANEGIEQIIEEDKKGKVCICDPPMPTADIDYLGMQGFIYNNGVHIELFMPSLEGFKTSSRSIDHADIQNEVYCFKKGNSDNIAMRLCEEELPKIESSDTDGEIPVIIVYNNAGNDRQRERDPTYGYNKCQYGELLEKTLDVDRNGRGRYWFFARNAKYDLEAEVNRVPPNSYKKYIKLKNAQEVRLDGGGLLKRGEKYLADDFQLDNTASSFKIKINVLKERPNNDVWYAFRKDLDDCKEKDIETIKSSSYRIQSYDKPLEQRYPAGFINVINANTTFSMRNIFPAEGIRIRYSDTVRTGGVNNLVRIKYENKYYFFRSIAAMRLNLSFNLYRDHPLTQYHVLGLPFFNKLEDRINDLKCDVTSLNRKIAYDIEREFASIAEFRHYENFAKAIYGREGLYKVLNTVIVQCPSYWEYKDDIRPGYYGFNNLYTENQKEKYRNYIRKQLWMTPQVKSKMDTPDARSFFYFHPINFLKYVCSELRLEFNPYKSKDIFVPKNDIDLKSRTQRNIQYSPGFAPLCPEHAEERVEYNGKFYGYCTSLFNIPREKGYGGTHSGIDLATNRENTDIISLIHGEVWECTWMGSPDFSSDYGKIMLIKGRYDNKLYLLAHLEDYIKKTGDHVDPGEPVAITGTTGISTGIHLHVEVYVDVTENYEKRYDLYSINASSGLSWIKKLQRVNPFDHTEIFGQWDGS